VTKAEKKRKEKKKKKRNKQKTIDDEGMTCGLKKGKGGGGRKKIIQPFVSQCSESLPLSRKKCRSPCPLTFERLCS
jgi:hypothetical protein